MKIKDLYKSIQEEHFGGYLCQQWQQQQQQQHQSSTVYQQAGCSGQGASRQKQTARGMYPNDMYQHKTEASPPVSASMILSFRLSELKKLLGFVGFSKSGSKTELQGRASEVLQLHSTTVQMKIKDLYMSIQEEQAGGYLCQQWQQQQRQPHQSSTVYQQARSSRQGASRQKQMALGMYPNDMYQYQPKASPPASVESTYPVNPDVRLKCLPLFELMGELLKPSCLVPQHREGLQQDYFIFHLTPQQATDIAGSQYLQPGKKKEYVIQVLMRFCLLETFREQDDCFPSFIIVKVNGRLCPLPE
jgi:hypothetical protein